jgi:uncharacterized membrane protein
LERPLQSDPAGLVSTSTEVPGNSPGSSAQPSPNSRLFALQRWLAAIAVALALGGVGIASYLALENLQGKSGVCTVVHGCQTVQQSAYGKILGIPVSVPGLAMYLFLASAAVVVFTNVRGLRTIASFLAFNGALFGFCFSLYLTYVEGWVLNAWCIYCIGSASLMTLLLLCWTSILAIERHRRSLVQEIVTT